ncbi:hypothetical protein MesoLj131a_37200 [Mesorhizobium sp. 131-2-1]|nr:hypothetical protein MesoLj131a_37200 [Mesorhizobium sp. 131-2-1]
MRPAWLTLGNLIASGLAQPARRSYSAAMTDKRSSRHLLAAATAAVILAAGCMLAGAAFADDSSTQKGTLPGVSSDYRIAKPAPQPEPDDALPAGGNGQFKIGDTDVRISGSITIDMATGGIRPPSH